jgi:hypothetical protein
MIPSSNTQPPEEGQRCDIGNFFSGGSMMGGNIVSGLTPGGKFIQIPHGSQTKPIKATLKYSKSHVSYFTPFSSLKNLSFP